MNSKVKDFVRRLQTLTLDDPRGRESRNALGLGDYDSYYSIYIDNQTPMDRHEQRRYDNLTRERDNARKSALTRDLRRDERRSYRRSLEEKSRHENKFKPTLARIESLPHPYSDDVLFERYGDRGYVDGNHAQIFSEHI